MPSVSIHIQGKILDLDKKIYLSSLHGISKGIHWISRLVCEDHRYGSINARGSKQTEFLQTKDEFHQALLDAIEDRQLRRYFEKLKVLAEKVVQHDAKMIEWLAAYFHIPSLDTPEARKNFNRKLSRERRKAFDNRSGLLGWVKESEWRKLEIEFLKTLADIQFVVTKIEERIGRLQ